MRWATLLCGQDSIAGLSLHAAENQILAWASASLENQSGMISGTPQPLPEPFLTTRFLNEVKSFDYGLERLKEILRSLRLRDEDFVQSMMRVSQIFQGDEARLIRWSELSSEFAGFSRWLPNFENSYQYLRDVFPTPVQELEEAKKELLRKAAEPHRFLNASVRAGFDCGFDEFKKTYIDFYSAAHEDTVHIVGNQERLESKVDSVALRNLELLSDLDYADRSYLNRARAFGKWVQAHQCDLPVRQILDHHARCYCNFNPKGSRHLAESIDQMNEAIREGIDHFRSVLRKCRMVIIQELKERGTEDAHSKPIAALLSRGPMIALKQQSVDILNAVIHKHAAAFGAGDHT